MPRLPGFLLAATVLTILPGAAARTARADDPPAPVGSLVPEVPPHPHRVFTLTISPLHLVLPVVELAGEYRALDKLGVALIAGLGRYTSDGTLANGEKLSAGVFEVGGQFRYYAVGTFRHGLQLGAEVLYLHLTTDQITATGEGVAMGPFAGYKIITDVGFTFDGQLGVEYVAARATERNGVSTASDTGAKWIPLLNLNVGWSF